MKKIISFLLVLFSLNVQGQKAINVACTDFTFNDKRSKDGKNITYIFETALTKSNTIIKSLARENLDIILSKIEEERNLAYDFDKETKKDLIVAGVDYLVTGNILTQAGFDTATIYIQFTKISGKDVTTKHSVSVFINKEDLNNLPKLENEIIKTLKQIPFVENIGFIEKDQLEEINKQFKEKDGRIKELELIEQERQKQKEMETVFKTTPPEVEIDFKLTDKKDSFAIFVTTKNYIPIKFNVEVFCANTNEPLSSEIYVSSLTTWHPGLENNISGETVLHSQLVFIYCGISKYNLSKKDLVKLKVEFDYQSIYYEELHYNKKFKDKIVKYYTFNPITNEIKKDY